MNRETKIGALLILTITTLISLVFFAEGMSLSQKKFDDNKILITNLQGKVDSLEKVVNLSFKNKKDTIIIKVVPQEVKVFFNNKSTKWFSFAF